MKNNKETTKKAKQDLFLIEEIAPKGGVSFRGADFVRTGTKFECCVNIYDFPGMIEENWMASLCGIEGTITTFDIHSADTNTVKTNVKRAMKEQNSRASLAKNIEDSIDAQKRLDELEQLYVDLSQMGEVIKYVQVRVFISASTREELSKRASKIIAAFSTDDFKGAVMINEQNWEWLSIFESYDEQQLKPNKRIGQPLPSNAVAGGNPFHFSLLDDPTGLYLGDTPSGGTVNFDQFTRNKARTSSCGVLLAAQGGGKSTLLKKLETHCNIAGGFVRAIDPMDEHYGICEENGGVILNMDGTNGIINMFEVYKTGDTQAISWQKHIKKLRTEYKCLKPDVPSTDIIIFESLIRDFYVDFGILPENPDEYNNYIIAGLPSEEYPIASDFVNFLERKMHIYETPTDAAHAQIGIDEMRVVNDVLVTFRNLINNHGTVINGYTSIPDLLDVPFVAFQTKNLHQMDPEIVDLITLNILYLSWDNCVSRGQHFRNLWEEGKIDYNDIPKFLITWDEFHRVLSARKLATINLIQEMLREMRHYFAGILLVSQSVRDFDPADNAETASLIRGIFELCQYKWIGRQEAGTNEILRKLFGGNLTESEYERINKLEQGEFIMGVSASNNLEVKVYASDDEIKAFKGGA